MIPAILFFLTLIAPPLFLAVWRGRRFEESIALTTGTMILFMFVCGIIGLLKASVYILLGSTAMLFGLSAWLVFRRKKGFLKTIAPFFTPASAAFFLIYIFLLYTHYDRMLHEWDEFTHWGDVVKAMVHIDAFSTSPLSHSAFQNYVPGMAIFQYLFEKIAMILPGGIFVDWRLYFSYHLLAAIFLLPFLTVRRWRYFLPGLLLILFIAVSPSFFDADGTYLSSIYVDGFLSLLAGAGFALLFLWKPSKRKTAHILVICALLVLTKDVGMLFAVTLACSFVITEISRKRRNIREILLSAGFTALAVALPKILWEISIRVNGATSMKFRQGINLGVLFRVITGQETGYAAEVGKASIERLLTGEVGFHGTIGIKLIYPVLAAILIGMLLLAWYFWNQQDPEEKKQHRISVWGIVVTFLLYCLGMPLFYMFLLNSNTLASFDRYMSIALGSLIGMTFLLFAAWMQERPRRVIAGVGAGILIGLMTLNPVLMEKYLNRVSVGDQYNVQGRYEQFVRAMNEIADGEEKHVWIICQETGGNDFWVIRYGIRPSNGEVNVGFSISDHTKSLYPGDIWTLVIPTEEWREKLKDYDYVMIYQAGNSFIEDYGSLFKTPEDIGDRTIFAINHETDLLERVY